MRDSNDLIQEQFYQGMQMKVQLSLSTSPPRNDDQILVSHPFQITPSYSFGKATKQNMKSNFYLPQIGSGKSQQFFPENYQPKSSQLRFDKYSSRREIKPDLDVPGPNFYNPQLPKNQGAISMKRKSTLKTVGSEANIASPGPGCYNLRTSKVQAQVGGLISRAQENQIKRLHTESPGVGTYNLQISSQLNIGSAFTKSDHKLSKFQVQTPGPSTYNSIQRLNETQGTIISSSQRKWEYQCQTSEYSPGPGTYNTQQTQKKTIISTQHAFRKPKREKLKTNDTFLNVLKTIPTVMKESARGSLINFPKSERNFEFLDVMGLNTKFQRSPGPAQYVSETIRRKGGVSFSQSKRSNIAKMDTCPGVGSYTTLASLGRTYQKPKPKLKIQIFQINLKDFNGFDNY